MNLDKNTIMKFNLLAIICIIIFCTALAPVSLQNDTFYTIKIGEHIINNGIDMKDPFSWHEDLPYTYPHWLYDVGIYLIYNLGEMTTLNNGGFIFINISTIMLSCCLGILIYLTCSKVSKNNLVSFIITLFAVYFMKDYVAARAQLVTFNLFVLTIFFIESFLETKKKRYLVGIVLISTAIANLHVAVWPFFFILFMPYIAAYVISFILEKNLLSKFLIYIAKLNIKRAQKKYDKQQNEDKKKILEKDLEKAKIKLKDREEKENRIILKSKERRENPFKIKITYNSAAKWLIVVVIICAFTGLLTPLGDTPYTYLIKTMQGNTMKHISEHLPLTLFNDKDAMIFLAIIFIVLIFTDTKIKLEDLFMTGGLIYLCFMSRRQTSMVYIVIAAIFAKWISYLANKYDKDGSEKLIKFITTLLGKTIAICIIAFISMCFIKPKIHDKFVNPDNYPVAACDWILENLDIENIKLYNEYNYGSYLLFKGIPVFIDSRADLYAPEFNKGNNEEARDIFSDVINISNLSTDYETLFDKYGFTHAIMYNTAKFNLIALKDNKFKELYKDDKFVIYEVQNSES